MIKISMLDMTFKIALNLNALCVKQTGELAMTALWPTSDVSFSESQRTNKNTFQFTA